MGVTEGGCATSDTQKTKPAEVFTGPNADETEYLPNQNGISVFWVTVVLFLFQYYLLKVPCDYRFLL